MPPASQRRMRAKGSMETKVLARDAMQGTLTTNPVGTDIDISERDSRSAERCWSWCPLLRRDHDSDRSGGGVKLREGRWWTGADGGHRDPSEGLTSRKVASAKPQKRVQVWWKIVVSRHQPAQTFANFVEPHVRVSADWMEASTRLRPNSSKQKNLASPSSLWWGFGQRRFGGEDSEGEELRAMWVLSDLKTRVHVYGAEDDFNMREEAPSITDFRGEQILSLPWIQRFGQWIAAEVGVIRNGSAHKQSDIPRRRHQDSIPRHICSTMKLAVRASPLPEDRYVHCDSSQILNVLEPLAQLHHTSRPRFLQSIPSRPPLTTTLARSFLSPVFAVSMPPLSVPLNTSMSPTQTSTLLNTLLKVVISSTTLSPFALYGSRSRRASESLWYLHSYSRCLPHAPQTKRPNPTKSNQSHI
ncbi:hypothetical protein D9619_009813 [Psilocybe cf. subviscida]|uniref:Uncharacterized protein n=1 Tax=Psilocybe cf. subviscida TaxID=2480587 RepID=A0A8H5BKT4_9AGAR|nr:hypothetical protein D9619_009813 [Psilocybe cf. subviscida]